MAYFEKDFDGNFQYSYNGVNVWILGNYVNPTGIEAYIEDEVFYDAVKDSYKSIDLTGRNKRDLERFNAKMNKTADWLRKKANGIYF
jgi:hypothetical protein